MGLCECGCGAEVKRRFVRGHQWRTKCGDVAHRKSTLVEAEKPWEVAGPNPAVATQDVVTFDSGLIIDGPMIRRTVIHEAVTTPPPHPLPFDHGKFRIAEEQPGTDLTQPWRLTRCLECREPTFSHDNTSKTKDEKLCESCAYLLLTELSERRVSKENRTQRGTYNPFDS